MDFHPVDRIGAGIRNSFQNIVAHPFQTAARMGAGAIGGPAAGALAAALFRGYNNRQNTQGMQNAMSGMQSRGNAAGQRAMDKPLNGALGSVPGGQGPSGDNSNLMNALMGNYGGQSGMNGGMYNMARQFGSMNPTNSSQLINGLLPGTSQNYDSSARAGGNLGIGPGQSGGANASGPQMMNGNQFGYSQAGGGYGAGVANGGGGMHSFAVNMPSLSASNYQGIDPGQGRRRGTSPRG